MYLWHFKVKQWWAFLVVIILITGKWSGQCSGAVKVQQYWRELFESGVLQGIFIFHISKYMKNIRTCAFLENRGLFNKIVLCICTLLPFPPLYISALYCWEPAAVVKWLEREGNILNWTTERCPIQGGRQAGRQAVWAGNQDLGYFPWPMLKSIQWLWLNKYLLYDVGRIASLMGM